MTLDFGLNEWRRNRNRNTWTSLGPCFEICLSISKALYHLNQGETPEIQNTWYLELNVEAILVR